MAEWEQNIKTSSLPDLVILIIKEAQQLDALFADRNSIGYLNRTNLIFRKNSTTAAINEIENFQTLIRECLKTEKPHSPKTKILAFIQLLQQLKLKFQDVQNII